MKSAIGLPNRCRNLRPFIFAGLLLLAAASYGANKAPGSGNKPFFVVVADHATGKGVCLMEFYGFNDLYAKLLNAAPAKRAAAFSALATMPSGYSALIIRMFLGDKEKTGRPGLLPKEGRVCDFACDALDKFYRYPFGKLPRDATTQDYDKQIAKWNQWFDKTVDRAFGPKGGPLHSGTLKLNVGGGPTAGGAGGGGAPHGK